MAKRSSANGTNGTLALFDDVALVETPKQKKIRKADPSPTARLIDHYYTLFLARHGCKPIINGAKDTGLLKKLVAAWGEDEVRDLIEIFLDPRQRDPRVVRSDYSIGAFYTVAQHLRLRGGRAVPDERTLHNLTAIERAMQPRQ